jgi:hypothetical protein
VRHGFGPERQIQTGLGALDVQRLKVRDRLASSDPAAKVHFTSNLLPKRARRSVSLDALLPVLYLKDEEDQRTIRGGVCPTQEPAFGHSFTPMAVIPSLQEALAAIPGADAPNLSRSIVPRLIAGWQSTTPGYGVTCLPAIKSISGLMACMCRRGWKKTLNVCRGSSA